jgi:hypothetical protein
MKFITVPSVYTHRSSEKNLSMISFKYFSVFALIVVGVAQHIVDLPCPERPVEQNFDIAKVILIFNFLLYFCVYVI